MILLRLQRRICAMWIPCPFSHRHSEALLDGTVWFMSAVRLSRWAILLHRADATGMPLRVVERPTIRNERIHTSRRTHHSFRPCASRIRPAASVPGCPKISRASRLSHRASVDRAVVSTSVEKDRRTGPRASAAPPHKCGARNHRVPRGARRRC